MSKYARIREAIKTIVKSMFLPSNIQGVVTAVSEANKTCTVKLTDDDVEVFDVRLMALAEDEADKGILIIPKIGSTVMVSPVENLDTMYVLTKYTEVQKIIIDVETDIIINGGNNEGLVKVNELVSDLNSIKSDLNTIKNVFKTWIPVANDGGSALKTASSTWANQSLQNSTKNNLQNAKVKH
jgi:hypothetical protein